MIRRPIPPTSLDFLLEILASTSASLPPPTSFHLPPSPSHETPITTSSSTSSSILSDILKNIKMKYHLPSLYERSFEFRSNDSPPPPHNMFRVMQFNLLAEGLSSSVHAIPPFPEYQELDGNYGGFDVDGNDDKEIIFDYTNCRRWRLLEEILRYSPDVLAVEECDHFDDFFYPILQSIGYSGKFQPKRNSPCCAFGYYSDGVALFWKNELFVEIPEVVRPSYNPKCTYVLTLLNHIPTNEPIILLATHLKAKSSLECENIRLSQVQHMLSDVDQVMKESGVNRCIFLGDFNADPCPIHKRETIIEPLTVQYVLSWKNNFFSSVYDLPNDQNSTLYTTSKYRGGILSKHVIDYIFYSNGYLDVHSRLGQLDPSNIESNGPSLPNLYYPSDHIAIVADMILTTP